MGRIFDALGTSLAKFQLGIGGPQLKNNAGAIETRNAADSAYAAASALLFQTYGDDFVLNKGATESGASWIFKMSRPSTGMTHDLQVIWPSSDPTVGMALTVTSFASNIITLGWTSVAAGTNLRQTHTTSIAFGSSSPVAMFTLPANAVILSVQVIVDTPFTGGTGPSLSVGVTGTLSKYLPSTEVDLTAAATTIFDTEPGLVADASSESIIATYAGGSATAGAARILTEYSIPS